jgi:hypothetical protein
MSGIPVLAAVLLACLADGPYVRGGDDFAPQLTSIFPPEVTVGEETTWTVTGRNLAGALRVHFDGESLSGRITKAGDTALVIRVRAEVGSSPGFRHVRIEGPGGLSNLLRVRVDRFASTFEREPNDDPRAATPLPRGLAAVGVLTPGDVDHFRVEARAGQRTTVEVEARRLGIPIAPVVTVTTSEGQSLVQRRATPGVSDDCRFLLTVPGDGAFIVQVRDSTYSGAPAPSAAYRLRVTNEPFASGLFPLAARAGRPTRFQVEGGNLRGARFKTVTPAGEPGSVIELGRFEGRKGVVEAPWRPVVSSSSGREWNEPAEDGDPATTLTLEPGVAVNGRIALPGEADRYRLDLHAGEPVRISVAASELGSWLDPVVSVHDTQDRLVAENDDAPFTTDPAGLSVRSEGAANPDSRVDLIPEEDRTAFVVVADRFGEGGPEYAYRLQAGPPRPDFAAEVRLPRRSTESPGSEGISGRDEPAGATGAFNLRPGTTTPLSVRVTFDGRVGPVTLRAEGLPQGVSVAPVTVRPSTIPKAAAPTTAVASLLVRVDSDARPALGELRVVGSSRTADGEVLRHEAAAALELDAVTVSPHSRPVRVRLARFRVVVLRSKGLEQSSGTRPLPR